MFHWLLQLEKQKTPPAPPFPRRTMIPDLMPDSHKFVHYHWIRVYINHARAEIAHVRIRYSLFQKQKENHLHQQ